MSNAARLLFEDVEQRSSPLLMNRSGYAFAAETHSAERLGGDFFLIVPRQSGVCVVIGDVCGRGRAAAEIGAAIYGPLYTLAHEINEPSRLLSALNDAALGCVPGDRFITAAALELEVGTGRLTIANAGHVPAMVRRVGGGTGIVGRASGPPVGMLPHASYFDERERLAEGDVMLMMTDGALEAIEADLIAMRSVAGLLTEAPEGARAIKDFILAEVERRVGGPSRDDLTVLSIERLLDSTVTTANDWVSS